MSDNPYKELRQIEKSQTLTALFINHKITSSDARLMTPEMWKQAAIAAAVRRPSEEVQSMVISALETHESYKNVDPFKKFRT